jgi:hypothetical protein
MAVKMPLWRWIEAIRRFNIGIYTHGVSRNVEETGYPARRRQDEGDMSPYDAPMIYLK